MRGKVAKRLRKAAKAIRVTMIDGPQTLEEAEKRVHKSAYKKLKKEYKRDKIR